MPLFHCHVSNKSVLLASPSKQSNCMHKWAHTMAPGRTFIWIQERKALQTTRLAKRWWRKWNLEILLIIVECKVLSCALDQAMIWQEWLSYPWLILRNENRREGVPFLNRFPATWFFQCPRVTGTVVMQEEAREQIDVEFLPIVIATWQEEWQLRLSSLWDWPMWMSVGELIDKGGKASNQILHDLCLTSCLELLLCFLSMMAYDLEV